MKTSASSLVKAANQLSMKAIVNSNESLFIMKANVKSLHSALQVITYGAVLSGSLVINQATAQNNISAPGQNPAQAQFDAGGKAVALGVFNAPTSGVSYRRMDGVNLSASNSNLPVTADEGLWRESLGLPIGSKILLSVSAAQAPADGVSQLKLKIEIFDTAGKPIFKPTKLLLEASLGFKMSHQHL
jgi:hypothetical protein